MKASTARAFAISFNFLRFTFVLSFATNARRDALQQNEITFSNSDQKTMRRKIEKMEE